MASSLSVNQLLDVASINSKTPDLNDGPAFSAYASAVQSITNGVYTKCNFPVEEFDTASCYDATTSRFQPNVAGYYDVGVCVSGNWSGSGYNGSFIYKNGVRVSGSLVSAATGPYQNHQTRKLLYLNGTTDYVEGYVIHNGGAAANTIAGEGAFWFQAHLVRRA